MRRILGHSEFPSLDAFVPVLDLGGDGFEAGHAGGFADRKAFAFVSSVDHSTSAPILRKVRLLQPPLRLTTEASSMIAQRLPQQAQ